MENLAEDTSTKAEDRAKIRGYLAKIKRFQFVSALLFLSEILEPISKLSLYLQGDSVDLLQAYAALERTRQRLDKLLILPVSNECQTTESCKSKTFNSGLSNLIDSAKSVLLSEEIESDKSQASVSVAEIPMVTYKGVKLTHVNQGLMNFNTHRQELINKLQGTLNRRFGELDELKVDPGDSQSESGELIVDSSVKKSDSRKSSSAAASNASADIKSHLGALKLLDTSLWPTEEKDLLQFGDDELNAFIEHFKTLLEKNCVNLGEIHNEWQQLKLYWCTALKHLKYNDVWETILIKYHQEKDNFNYPNFIHVVQILRIYPVSNAKVERGFSAVNRVKTDWRCSLGNSILDCLIRIDIEGPDPHSFDPTPITRKFFGKRRHPNVLPYGPRKKMKVGNASESVAKDDDN